MNSDQQHPEPTLQHFVQIVDGYVPLTDVKTVVELGARDCVESVAFADRFPNAQIYAFECNPATLPICERAAEQRENITLIRRAVTDTDGTVTFYPTDPEQTQTTWDDGNPGASSLLVASGKYPVEQYVQGTLEVQAVTLKRFLHEHGLSGIDLLWMDIQGAELAALRGLGDDLGTITAIHTEAEFFEIYAGQPLFWAVWWYLRRRGFSLVGFTSLSGFAADAVFLRRSLLSPLRRANISINEVRLLWKTAPAAYRLLRRRQPEW